MATIAPPRAPPRRAVPLHITAVDRVLAVLAAALLAAVLVALFRGRAEWSRVPWQVWPHLVTIVVALALTPPMLLRPRGDRWHRRLGRVWVVAMVLTAALSFNLREVNAGRLSSIHFLSAWTVVQAPLIWWSARTHRLAMHRRAVSGMVIGALLVAGFFTFPFHRLLGHWLFG